MAKQELSFREQQKNIQEKWKHGHISNPKCGIQNGGKYSHIIPKKIWLETVWPGIKGELPKYLASHKIQPHTGIHNLLSSWVVSANLYFPIRLHSSLKELMVKFLNSKLNVSITCISEVELEFAFEDNLSPSQLLGEVGGSRGSGQTSPDVAFLVSIGNESGLILTECKFTEHSFYPCSARREESKGDKEGNQDPSRCMKRANGYNYRNICQQSVWKRKYWDLLKLSEYGEKVLTRCPAATAGYQLFRQQALAAGILSNSSFNLVASTVAFDERNTSLVKSLRSTGVEDFQTDWGKLFAGEVVFKTWTHQEWVQFVRNNQVDNEWDDWLNYLKERYGY